MKHRKNEGVWINNRYFKNPPVLMCASVHGHLRAVECLLAKGSDVNAIDDIGQTSLHAASYAGHSSVVSALIRAGAEVNKKASRSAWEFTPLHYASYNNHPSCIRILLVV